MAYWLVSSIVCVCFVEYLDKFFTCFLITQNLHLHIVQQTNFYGTIQNLSKISSQRCYGVLMRRDARLPTGLISCQMYDLRRTNIISVEKIIIVYFFDFYNILTSISLSETGKEIKIFSYQSLSIPKNSANISPCSLMHWWISKLEKCFAECH